MHLNQILSRLIGLSLPVGGDEVPSAVERALAQEVVAFLEQRRVMYHPGALEAPHHCVSSIFVICDTLTGFIARLDSEGQLSDTLRGMRGACNKFLHSVHADRGRKLEYPVHPGHYGNWVFDTALGEFRGVMGVHLARMAARHQLNIGDQLATILPGPDQHDRGRH